MKRFLQITVLMALMMVIMGTALFAQMVDIPVQIDRRHTPGCGWGGKANDPFNVAVYYRVGSSDILANVYTIHNGEGMVQYSIPIATALGATGIKFEISPANGIGTPSPQLRLQTVGSAVPIQCTFSLIPPANPNMSHRCL